MELVCKVNLPDEELVQFSTLHAGVIFFAPLVNNKTKPGDVQIVKPVMSCIVLQQLLRHWFSVCQS